MRFEESRNQPRFFVTGITASLAVDGKPIGDIVPVVDIGPLGLSLVTDQRLKKGETVTVTVSSEGHSVRCEAEVRNSVTYSHGQEYQRVGLLLLAMERIDAVRWKQIYSSVLESSKMAVSGTLTEKDAGLNQRLKRAS
jgi:hypothetical protein